MAKIKNSSHTRQPIHTVDGVRHIGARKTRSFELSKPGEKLVNASEALSIVSEEKPKAKAKTKKITSKPVEAQRAPEALDVHGEGGSAPAGGSDEGGGGSAWPIEG